MTVDMNITEEAGVRVVECAARTLAGHGDAAFGEFFTWLQGDDRRVYHACVAAVVLAAQLANKVAAQQGLTVDSPETLFRLADIDWWAEQWKEDPDVVVIAQTIVAFANDDRSMGMDMIVAHHAVAGSAGLTFMAVGATGMVGDLMKADPTIVIGPPRKKL